MQVNYQGLVKEQVVYIAIPVALTAIFLGAIIFTGMTFFNNFSAYNAKSKEVTTLTEQKASLELKLKQQETEAKDPELKQIYSLEGMKFGADASFAPLFENMINVAKESGIRIRSVNYNYAPQGDPILAAKLPGYNVCELETTVVGKYSALQRFLKTILSEDYLVNLAQLEIVSWKRDRSVLITNLKLRFYTKTN